MNRQRCIHLPNSLNICRFVCLFDQAGKRGDQHRSQDSDHCDYDHKFYDGKTLFVFSLFHVFLLYTFSA
jgi:hypothetical protein